MKTNQSIEITGLDSDIGIQKLIKNKIQPPNKSHIKLISCTGKEKRYKEQAQGKLEGQ